jgi:DNA (cytosine-5)-methyltransferase 1
MNRKPELLLYDDELIVDSFAGGGGASEGIFQALGRHPDIAVNHDAEAIAMHKANHPSTQHYVEDVWAINPRKAVRGRRIGLMWFSPDCKHFSKAKGGKPVSKKIRGLAWVVMRWASLPRPMKPRVICLENVEEFQEWGPLLEDGRPCPVRKGLTFRRFVKQLENCGYEVQHRELRACDYGSPTIRKRLFIVARSDGQPIVWPEPTHAKDGAGGKLPWRTAAECIDWTLPAPSIFERARPLAENTLKRIARGVDRYVVKSPRPFIVGAGGPARTGEPRPVERPLHTLTTKNDSNVVTPFLSPVNHAGGEGRAYRLNEPMKTITAAPRGETALIAPVLAGVGGRASQSPERPANVPVGTITAKADTAIVCPVIARIAQTGGNGKYANGVDEPITTITSKAEHLLVSATVINTRNGEREGQAPRVRDIEEPMPTVTAKGSQGALVSAFLAQHNTGMVGHDAREPVSTIVGKGCTQALVSADIAELPLFASTLTKFKGTCPDGQAIDEPLHTVQAGGFHYGEVRAFLMKYHTEGGQLADLHDPAPTVLANDNLGLVTVNGVQHRIVDIGMRMLQPKELFRAQGFRPDYRIEIEFKGKPLTKTAQVRMCGNSVCPPLAKAIVEAQFKKPAEMEVAA